MSLANGLKILSKEKLIRKWKKMGKFRVNHCDNGMLPPHQQEIIIIITKHEIL